MINVFFKRSYLVFMAICACCLFSVAAIAQDKVNFTAKGVVKDEVGEPVVGASVVLRGTNLGTVTNADGAYTLTGAVTNGNYDLVVSFIGYTNKSIPVEISATNPNTNISEDFSLSPDALNLGELVVIGSSILQEKKQLGNSITTIRGDQLANSGTGNVIQGLQGKVAGAQITQNSGDPAGGITVRLRGAKSLLGSSEPLYVIDGVVINNNTVNITNANVGAGGTSQIGQNRMADINPNDIESLNVINGAAAAAIYGSRASNGVVVITTKRGKSGKPKISFSTSYTFNQLRKKSFFSVFGKQFNPSDTVSKFDPQLQTLFPTSKGDPNRSGIAFDSVALWGGVVDVTRFDYHDAIFRDAGGTDNNLSVSGGNDNTRYFASVNFMRNEGIIKNTDFSRIAGRVRVDQKVTNWLDASVGLAYNNGFSNELPNGNVFFSPTNSINITNNIFKLDALDANGNYQAVERLTRVNPLSIIDFIKNTQETNRTIADLQLTARPLEGLTISYILGVDNTSQLGRNYSPIYPYPVNLGFFNNGYVANNTAITNLFNNDINVTYSKKFGNFLSTTVGGFNYQISREQITFTEGRDLAPFTTTINGARTILPPTIVDARGAVAGGFLQETFGYNDRVFLTLAGRIDATSRFPTQNRVNFYPKVGLSYILSSEPFWANLKNTVSQFRLRASWGQTGNVTGYGVYDRFPRVRSSSFNALTAYNVFNDVADPNVKVERNEELEIGTDLAFLNDRINLSFNWYRNTSSDLLLDANIAPSRGGPTSRTNVGTLQNTGVELTLGFSPLKTKDLNWNVFATYNHNENIVTDLPNGLTQIASPTGAPIFIMKGASVGVFYGTFYAKGANGENLLRPIKVALLKDGKTAETKINQLPQVERGPQQLSQTPLVFQSFRGADGQPTIAGTNSVAQRKIIGNPNPRNIWSAGTSFTYKKLTFNALFDGIAGMEVFNADKRTRNNVGIGFVSEQELKGEVPRGTVAALANIEEFRVDDGSFMKLRELALSYDFGSLIKGVEGLQLSVIGRNLYSWDNYFGYDPETKATGQSSVARGIDFGNSPIPRSVQVMLRANF